MKQATLRKVLPPLLVAPKVLLGVAGVVVYGLLAHLLFGYFEIPASDFGQELTVLNGIVLGVLLVFRNNAAYDRWWEGRKLWGGLINDVRNLCLAARSLAEPNGQETKDLGRSLIGFAHALRLHLRGGGKLAEIPGFEADDRNPPHIPGFMANRVHAQIAGWHKTKRIDGFGMHVLLGIARGLMDACGACERIRNTPLAYSYRALLRHGTILYMAIAPIYTIGAFGPWGIPVLALVFYFLIGVEVAAEDIEEPFGLDGDDLALDDFCKVVETSVTELLLTEPGDEADARSAAEGLSIPYAPSRAPEAVAANSS